MIKAAIIGLGDISFVHLDGILGNPEIQLVAACDLNEELKSRVPEGTPFYTDYKKMIAENDITLASIATESGIHAEIALHCIDQGVNVIIEKPMAMSIDDAEEIIRRSEEKGVKVSACHQNRFNVAIQELRRAVEAERFGRLSHGSIHVRWNRN